METEKSNCPTCTIDEYRERLDRAHLMYQMGYTYKDKNKMLYDDIAYERLDELCSDMYDLYASALQVVGIELGQKIVQTYDGKNGNVKGSEIAKCRTLARNLSTLMMKESSGLFDDIKDCGTTLMNIAKFTLVDKFTDIICDTELEQQCYNLENELSYQH